MAASAAAAPAGRDTLAAEGGDGVPQGIGTAAPELDAAWGVAPWPHHALKRQAPRASGAAAWEASGAAAELNT
jgi:hypothetical protein